MPACSCGRCNSSAVNSKLLLEEAGLLLPHLQQLLSRPAAQSGSAQPYARSGTEQNNNGSIGGAAQQQQQQLSALQHPTASAMATAPDCSAPAKQLLPAWSLVKLEWHAAVAGDGASTTVLDANPERWLQQGTAAGRCLQDCSTYRLLGRDGAQHQLCSRAAEQGLAAPDSTILLLAPLALYAHIAEQQRNHCLHDGSSVPCF